MNEINENQYIENYMMAIIKKIRNGDFESKDKLLEELRNDEKFSNLAELRDDLYNIILNEYNKYIEQQFKDSNSNINNHSNENNVDDNIINELYNDPEWYSKIMNSNHTADIKNALIDKISTRKREEQKSFQNETRPKVYELNNHQFKRNGFLEIVLLSMITLLFSILCVTNIYIQIIDF